MQQADECRKCSGSRSCTRHYFVCTFAHARTRYFLSSAKFVCTRSTCTVLVCVHTAVPYGPAIRCANELCNAYLICTFTAYHNVSSMPTHTDYFELCCCPLVISVTLQLSLPLGMTVVLRMYSPDYKNDIHVGKA